MTKTMSKAELRDYFYSILYKPRIISYIQESSRLQRNKGKPKMLNDYTPKMTYSRMPGRGDLRTAAGVCKGCGDIRIADWILVDSTQAKAVVRHELAHALQHYKYGFGTRAHGKEFIEALKIVSPNNWRNDRHYRETPEIFKARIKSFGNNKISLTCTG